MAAAQHGVVTREQLLRIGFTRHAVDHRIARGRLHPVRRGVYAVGRPSLTRRGRWMAALLACSAATGAPRAPGGAPENRDDASMALPAHGRAFPGAVLSHQSAAALWRIGWERPGVIEISVRSRSPRRLRGLLVHRRPTLRDGDVTVHDGIPVTSPVQTLLDLTPRLGRAALERIINEADIYDLVSPPALREELARRYGEPGVARLELVLDRRTFRLTATELERWLLPLAHDVGLPVPLTRQWVNGFEVDFFWPDLGLVIETDGLRYHRTPAEQARDRLRDQTHTASGLTQLRFTHEQIRYESDHVRRVLAMTFGLIEGRRAPAAS